MTEETPLYAFRLAWLARHLTGQQPPRRATPFQHRLIQNVIFVVAPILVTIVPLIQHIYVLTQLRHFECYMAWSFSYIRIASYI